MSDSQDRSVLRRKVQSGKSQTVITSMSPEKALRIAIPKAGMVANKLQLNVMAVRSDRLALDPVLEFIPPRGLYLRLDGPNAANGFAILDAAFLEAIVEMQTTGRVSSGEVVARRPTKTDAVISEDLINDCLRTFALALDGMPDWRWAHGYDVSAQLDGPRALGLLLEDVTFRVFTIDLEIAGGLTSGQLVLGMPADGREAGPGNGTISEQDETWSRNMHSSVGQAQASLRVVLHRQILPLAGTGRLRVGELLMLPADALSAVRIETPQGDCAAIGRLGQFRGFRAIKLAGPGASGADGDAGRRQIDAAAPKDPAAAPQIGHQSDPTKMPQDGGDIAGLPDTGGFDVPELPQLPQMAETSGLPELPDMPGLPELPDMPGLPDLPDLPELPEMPGLPELPGQSDLPDLPELPQMPDLPKLP